jgi:hypothetical protein
VARKRKIKLPNGQEVEGFELTFRSSGEEWNEYLIDDGTVLRFKSVVTEVIRVEGAYDDQGQPLYLVNAQNIVKVSAPEELQRPPGESS